MAGMKLEEQSALIYLFKVTAYIYINNMKISLNIFVSNSTKQKLHKKKVNYITEREKVELYMKLATQISQVTFIYQQ